LRFLCLRVSGAVAPSASVETDLSRKRTNYMVAGSSIRCYSKLTIDRVSVTHKLQLTQPFRYGEMAMLHVDSCWTTLLAEA
jgi:hypothetical protein